MTPTSNYITYLKKSTRFLLVFSQLCKFSNLGRVVLEKCIYSRMRLLFIKNHYNLQSQNLSRLCFHLSHFYTFSMKIFLKFRSSSTKNIDISNQYFGDSFMSPRDYFEQHMSKTGKKYFKTGFFICLCNSWRPRIRPNVWPLANNCQAIMKSLLGNEF